MEQQRGDLLDISGLRVVFNTYAGQVKALNGVELWMKSRGAFGRCRRDRLRQVGDCFIGYAPDRGTRGNNERCSLV